ncbi:MAG: NAD(+)/NADH kinase [Puniceicoccaceae bacterium]|nr:MAG: NAD(+)/NADH kinase [Puniceicoccaceae bacterium]
MTAAPASPGPVERLAIVINQDKPGAETLARRLADLACAHGRTVEVSDLYPLPRDFLKGADLCVVVGGDGTLLGVVAAALEHDVPVMGVNRGSLGFLTVFPADGIEEDFARLLDGAFGIGRRAVLRGRSADGAEGVALNDILVKENGAFRLVHLQVEADGGLVTDFYCDGLIFSTPTGSTAYNLSAGGPLMHPETAAVALTPICPHTLSNRSIIFPDTVHLTVSGGSGHPRLLVAMDGQCPPGFGEANRLEISLDPRRLRLAQPPDYAYFETVRKKLDWSGGMRPIRG